MNKKYTHQDLVEIGYRWILKNASVGFAFKELKTMAAEIPDVIGFNHYESTLIECKCSRADFMKDKKKVHRQLKGMGVWRFFLCPAGLIMATDLPLKWGLIWVDEKGRAKVQRDPRKKIIQEPVKNEWQKKQYPEGFYYRMVRAAENKFDVDPDAERAIMYSALRRLFIKGHMHSIYDGQYNKLTNGQILKQYEKLIP